MQININMNQVKKNQLDAQLILSIFHQPLHVSGVACSAGWIVPIQPAQQTVI